MKLSDFIDADIIDAAHIDPQYKVDDTLLNWPILVIEVQLLRDIRKLTQAVEKMNGNHSPDGRDYPYDLPYAGTVVCESP